MEKRCVSKSVRNWVISRQDNKCKSCSMFLETTVEVDHIDPLWHGGSNAASNLQALCPNCHARKSKVEQSMIPRVTSTPGYKFCPLCTVTFADKFGHVCPKFSIVNPATFRLHFVKKKPNRLQRFVFDQ